MPTPHEPRVEGINIPAVTDWLQQRTEVAPPLSFSMITGGHSNLTYRVVDAEDRAWVLRRPPLNSVLATAHDMAREHRVVSALASSSVPVPTLVGLCEDEAVNGAPFYVMNFVEGLVARTASIAATLPLEVRGRTGDRMIDVLAQLHAIDPDAVGLGGLARREDYIGRQLRRWARQLDAIQGRDLSTLRQVHQALSQRVPPQTRTGVVHGDYRLDNCIITPEGDIAAVLDWELCTLGDVRADLGMLLVYWAEPDDDLLPLESPPSTADGFAGRRHLAERYRAQTGDDFDELPFFFAFSLWRLACILEGVYARYVAGAKGEVVPDDVERFATTAGQLGARAKEILDGRPVF